MKHHPTYQPSAFPAWAQCPSWDGKPAAEDDDAVNAGVLQHKLLADSFTSNQPGRENTYVQGMMSLNLDDEDQTKDIDSDTLFVVRRAHDNILAKLKEFYPDEDYLLFPEELCSDTEGIFKAYAGDIPLFGTADLVVVPRHGTTLTVVDYKSRYTNKSYWQQLMFYAVCFASEGSKFTHANMLVVYGDSGTAEWHTHSLSECRNFIHLILEARRSSPLVPRKSGAWCDLCANCGSCAVAQGIVKRANELVPLPEEEVVKPWEYPAFLAICSAVEKRIKAFREHALRYAKENGGVITDGDGNIAYEVQTTQRTEIDINQFYKATREFLSPNAIIAAAKLPKTKAKELLKATGTMTTKEIEATLKMTSTEPTTIEKLVRHTKGN